MSGLTDIWGNPVLSPLERAKLANSPTAMDEWRECVARRLEEREPLKADRCQWDISEDDQSGRFAA